MSNRQAAGDQARSCTVGAQPKSAMGEYGVTTGTVWAVIVSRSDRD
ncbi:MULTISPECIES: hypothetical protein [unclassified Streptomyces]|nr:MULTISPECIES: hypothetical protein [unclassified Streptomyces]